MMYTNTAVPFYTISLSVCLRYFNKKQTIVRYKFLPQIKYLLVTPTKLMIGNLG